MENERNENLPPTHGDTSKPSGVLSFLPGIKSLLSPTVRMNPTSLPVNQTTPNRLLEGSSPNRSILRDISSIISFNPGSSPKSSVDTNCADVPSIEKESETVVKSLLNEIVSSVPDKSEAKNRVSGISEVSENSFETAVGGEPVGHLPDLVQLGTSFQSGFGSDTDTSAVYESAGENEDSVSPEESYRDLTLYDTPDADQTKVLDSSVGSVSTVTAPCFTCVDTDSPSDSKESQFVPKGNPALSHLHEKPDLNLSDLAKNLEKLYLQTPLKNRTSLPPKSEDNSVLELSASTETEWLDSDVEVRIHGRRPSDPVIVYEGKSTLSHGCGRPSVEVLPEEVEVLNATFEVAQNSQKVPNCVELTEDSVSKSDPVFAGSEISVQEASKQREAPGASTTEVARVCELKANDEDSNAEVCAITSTLGQVSLKGSKPNDVETRASCDVNVEENVVPPETTGETGEATSAEVVEASSSLNEVSVSEKTVENEEVTPAETSPSLNEVSGAPENTVEYDKATPLEIAESSSLGEVAFAAGNAVEKGEVTPTEVIDETSSSFSEVTVSGNTVENCEITPAEVAETLPSLNEVSIAPENTVEYDNATPLELAESSSPGEVSVATGNTVATPGESPAIPFVESQIARAAEPVLVADENSLLSSPAPAPNSDTSICSRQEIANPPVADLAAEASQSPSKAKGEVEARKKPVFHEVSSSKHVKEVESSEEVLKENVAPAVLAQEPYQAVQTEELSKEGAAVKSGEEVAKEVSQAVVETAQEEVLPEEPIKKTPPAEHPVEVSKEHLPSTPESLKKGVPESVRKEKKVTVQAVRTEDLLESDEKAVEQASQAVVAEVLPKEPIKETPPTVPPVGISKEDTPQAVLDEVIVQEVTEEVSQTVPVEVLLGYSLKETAQQIPALSPESPEKGVAAEENVTDEAVRTGDLSVEEVASVGPGEKSARGFQTVVTEEKALEKTSSDVLPVETPEEVSVQVAPAKENVNAEVLPGDPIKEIESPAAATYEASLKKDLSQTVIAKGTEEVLQITDLSKEVVVAVESTGKVEEDLPLAAPPAETTEKVGTASDTTKEAPESKVSPAEIYPAEPINELCTQEETASGLDATPSAAEKVEPSQEEAGKCACRTPRIATIRRASITSSNCTPDLTEGVATSTPLESDAKLNTTIDLDDTIDVATLNTSPDELNRAIVEVKSPEALDFSKGSEVPLDLSSYEAPLNSSGSEPSQNLPRTPEGPLDLTCAASATLNTTRTIEVSPKFLKAVTGPSFDQTFDVGAIGEPNFNSTFVRHDRTVTQQTNSTFVVPEENPANVTRRVSPPKARSAFSSADAASKVDSLRSLIAVCEQQEKNLREEADLVHGEKEPSPDFEALSAEAAKVTEEISLSLREIDQKDLGNETAMANNFDEDNPFATKSKIAASPPLGRREVPPALNGSQASDTLSSKVNTLDLNVSEAGPDTAGDHFQSEEIAGKYVLTCRTNRRLCCAAADDSLCVYGMKDPPVRYLFFDISEEVFRDPATFDFLSQIGSSTSRRELAKESLYVKFDPLVGFTSNTTSDIPLPRSATMQHNHSETSPAKEEEPERPERQSGEPASTDAPKPTKKVESSVGESTETEPSPPPRTPLRTKATALATETLISLSPAGGAATPVPKKAEASVPATPVQGTTTKDTSLRGQVVTQEELIKRLQEHQIVLEEQDKAYQDRIAELERENEQLNKKVQDKTQGLNQLSLIMKEYEKTISRLVAEMEQEKKVHEEEKENLVKERDSIQGHLNNIEIAFADLHKKYERSKVMIEGFKKNEEVLNAAAAENKANLDKMQNMYDMLKAHAVQKLDTANQELVAIKQRHQQETAKLNAVVKKLEIKSKSLEESLEQKTKENQALAQICDELINANT